MKRVYAETVKKWAKGIGISGMTLIGLIFMYLIAVGAISNVSYSGDVVCAGTEADPCYAYINFTAEEDIFIYPVGYDPWGRDTLFNFDPNVKSWRLERSWGKGWRNIPLNKSCTGTWCGLSSSKDERKFSIAFRDGRDYQIRIVAMKNSPYDTIKWGAFSGVDEIDPVWNNKMINKSIQEKLRDKDYQNYLKITDSLRIKKSDYYKTYNSLEKRILIEDNNNKILIDFKLTSDYKTHVVAGNDTKVAELFLYDWTGNNLFDSVDFYDVQNNYKNKARTYWFKYGVDYNETSCYPKINDTEGKVICENNTLTNWINFNYLNELPHKNIKVGLFTDTTLGEEIEWIPIIEGFEILEWASYLVTNLVRYWKLDETSGTIAEDSTDTQNGTYTDTFTLDINGIIGRAISLNNGYVAYSPRPFNSSMSFQFWFKTTNSLTRRHFPLGNGYNALAIRNSTTLDWFPNTAGGDILTATIGSAFNDGAWHHVVITQSGTSAVIYFDGSLANSGTVASLSSSSTTGRIGEYVGISSEYYIGDIDEVAIWTRELTSDEVTELWNSGNGLAYPFELEDTCTYTSGNWIIDCNDNCTISSDVAMGGNDLVFSNIGTFRMSANITGYGNINLSSGCSIILDDNTFLIN